VNVTVNEPVDAAFWTSHDTYHVGEVVQFVNLSTQAFQYSWDFDEPPAGNSTLQYPLYTYTSTGIKNIILIASNSCYADTSSAEITIIDPSSVQNASMDKVFGIYPNPGNEYFIISGELNGSGTFIITATDMLGRTSILTTSEYHNGRLNCIATTEKLPFGVYIIELRTDAENIRFKWLKTK
jgi:PKD repeat protein